MIPHIPLYITPRLRASTDAWIRTAGRAFRLLLGTRGYVWIALDDERDRGCRLVPGDVVGVRDADADLDRGGHRAQVDSRQGYALDLAQRGRIAADDDRCRTDRDPDELILGRRRLCRRGGDQRHCGERRALLSLDVDGNRCHIEA